jgi:CubicO group peptidase (beta-lactamase class C family)
MPNRALRRTALALCTLTLASPLSGATPRGPARAEAAVDRIVRAAMAEHGTPGLVIGVVDGGRVVLAKGYGSRSLPSGTPPDADTVFFIGSISKAVTAVGTMLLVDEGKVRLDDPVGNYLPGLPPAWHAITVRQLMTHTSGLPQVKKAPSFAAALRQAAREPLHFAPGTDQEYNNFNFAIIGQLIEAVSGTPYLLYMQQRVFAPLHMGSTGVGVRSRDRAMGYVPGPHGPRPGAPDIAAYGVPSGGLESTLNDLLKLEHALWEQKLMKGETYRKMWAPSVPPGSHHVWSFTPGWKRRVAGGTEVIAKNGAVAGFASMWQRLPGRGSAVILLWNLKGKGNDFWRPAAELVHKLFGVPLPGRGDAEEVSGEDG